MKRIIAVVGALLAAACFVLCIAAIIWMWSIQKPVIDKTTIAFDRADEVLAIAEKTIDNVRVNLEQSRGHVQLVRTSASRADDQSGFFEKTIARTAAKKMSPDINEVQHSLEKVTEASIVINSILDSLHDVEGLERLDTNQVRTLQTQMVGVTRASLDLGNLLDDPRQRSGGESAVERSERIAANLESVVQLADEFQKGVIALRKRVRHYQDKSLLLLNRGPIWVTVGLGWVAISQLVVIGVAFRTIRKPRIPNGTP